MHCQKKEEQREPDAWDIKRRTYCDECPHRALREAYREGDGSMYNAGLEEILEQRMGELGKNYDVDKLFNLVVEVAQTEENRGGLTVKGGQLLATFLSERYKYERFIDATKPKN